jgi:hypothetical protein
MNHPYFRVSALLLMAVILTWYFGKARNESEPSKEQARNGMPQAVVGAAPPAAAAERMHAAGANLNSNTNTESNPCGAAVGQESAAATSRSIQVQKINMTLPATGDHVLREQAQTMQPTLRELGQDFDALQFQTLKLPLFDSRMLVLEHVSHRAIGGSVGVFTGSVTGEPHGGHVVLSYVNDAVAATIHLPGTGESYEIRTGADGFSHILSQLDPTKIPPCGSCLHNLEPP